MRLLYVVQRYGTTIAGGAEQHCREIAERLVQRGYQVDVATTCAESYVDWADALPPGSSVVEGVTVRRFPVATTRNSDLFNALNGRMISSRSARPLTLQREWMRLQGPHSPALVQSLRRNLGNYDCVIFITYLYWTSWAGLHTCTGRVPTILHPTVHDEPPVKLSLFNEVFRAPNRIAYLSPEERDFVVRRFPGAPDGDIVGVGVDLPDVVDAGAFRRRYVGDDPYVLYLGRVDAQKGAEELIEFFVTYKERNPGPLKLALLGQALIDIPVRDDIVVTGFVDPEIRDAALAGARALVQPSYIESFSMALTEAFAHRRPAIVQGRCEVLLGHARRSGAAIPYSGFAEFEAAIELLSEDAARADAMGAAGRAYVEREYSWGVVLDRYEDLLRRAVAGPV